MNSPAVNHSCDQVQQPLLAMDKVLKLLLSKAKTPNQTYNVLLDDSLNRVLAQDIFSTINVPEFDNSAVDGYAIALWPNQINTPEVLNFKITDRIPAGILGKALAPGCTARIFTGAPIPSGANCVVMQEACEVSVDNNNIQTWQPLALNENIRPMGNDILIGDVILPMGTQLKPQDITLAASIGTSELSVFKKITVGVFFTGDELVEPGNDLMNAQIFNSNRYALIAMLKTLNCKVVDLGNIQDNLNATCEALTSLATNCDLIITTGGVSVGEKDYIKPALEKLSKLSLWRINMKPGKPLAFGNIGKTAFIGLPGNPVSAMVTFLLFARPFIKKIQGINHHTNQPSLVKCDFDWHRAIPRREFIRVQLDTSASPALASPYTKQGSDILSSLVCLKYQKTPPLTKVKFSIIIHSTS